MKILAFDPGAERMGWAVLEGNGKEAPRFHGSGIYGLKREQAGKKKEPYQKYRLRLIDYWAEHAPSILETHKPNTVISEIVPVVGGGNFVAATQSQLAGTAITTVQAVAVSQGYKVMQIGATTVKAKIGGKGSATKVAVRNGVYTLVPHIKANRERMWKIIFDESDAFAIALCALGYSNKKKA
jgi:Holliday junction resolvasome RuvABC endonuclease subunit